ncbi:hypothetical protein VOWphi5012_066 [Vibrio phage phi50-12]|uniref:Uncharacterized protein n=1 Tax=Vibrio phage phi50-12 TaxID=2654972 RepID=A0A5P8PRC7_9CAUD|nr:hypothetical protein KNU82_gp066 [Vibrio phage phi50-12]QFR59850.1 hypothetical protein VOWphi5012_066 [Vibrio phage phi50-12]
MVTYTFQEVSTKGVIKQECCVEGCKKKTQETKKFYQTLNPYNRNKKGEVKTREEIVQEINERKREWLASKDGKLLCKDHR